MCSPIAHAPRPSGRATPPVQLDRYDAAMGGVKAASYQERDGGTRLGEGGWVEGDSEGGREGGR